MHCSKQGTSNDSTADVVCLMQQTSMGSASRAEVAVCSGHRGTQRELSRDVVRVTPILFFSHKEGSGTMPYPQWAAATHPRKGGTKD